MASLLNDFSLEQLSDTRTETSVLAYIMHDTLILSDDRYILSADDFHIMVHKIAFSLIYNHAEAEGVKSCTPADVLGWFNQIHSPYIEDFNALVPVLSMEKEYSKEIFEGDYKYLKKLSLMRELKRNGFDISDFFSNNNENLGDKMIDSTFSQYTVESILNHEKEKLIQIENHHIGKDNGQSKFAAEGLKNLVEELKENPEVGFPIDGDILNYATRGARLGKMYLYSAPSGFGKTRFMLGAACSIALPYLDADGKVVLRDGGYRKVLFMTTEQQADEIQTMILAYVSGVNEKNILLGQYSPAESQKIETALKLIEDYKDNFIIDAMPDPSLAMVKTRLVKWIIQGGVEYIFYDYVFTSPGLISEFSQSKIREDVALMMLSNTLKEIAMTYNVYVQSATQLNDGWSKKEVGLRDQNCIRGSKAIADKADIGLIGVRINDAEKERIGPSLAQMKAMNVVKQDPNIVIDIYKNRRGEMNNVKIWRNFDFGTCRCTDLFATDANYNVIDTSFKFKTKMQTMDYLSLCTMREQQKKAESQSDAEEEVK